MTRSIYSLLALFLFASCTGYSIEGKIDRAKGGKAALFDIVTQDTINRTMVDSTGQFTMEGRVKATTFAAVTINGKRVANFYLENSPITITRRGRARLTTVKGGETQSLYNKCTSLSSKQIEEKRTVSRRYQMAKKESPDTVLEPLEIQLQRIDSRYRANEDSLFYANTNNIAAARIVMNRLLQNTTTTEDAERMYMALSGRVKKTAFGKKLVETIETNKRLEVGQKVEDFSVTLSTGETFSLYSMPGKYKLIDFWASNNAICVQSFPILKSFYDQFNPLGLEMVSISMDNDENIWRNVITKFELTWAQGNSFQGVECPVFRQFGIERLPNNILLDADNRVVARDLNMRSLFDTLTELLK